MEIKKILDEQKYEPGTVLRVGVTGGGCSGFSYSLGLDKNFDEKMDSKSEQHGVGEEEFAPWHIGPTL